MRYQSHQSTQSFLSFFKLPEHVALKWTEVRVSGSSRMMQMVDRGEEMNRMLWGVKCPANVLGEEINYSKQRENSLYE